METVSIAPALRAFEDAEQHLLATLIVAATTLHPDKYTATAAVERFAHDSERAWEQLYRDLDIDVSAAGDVVRSP